MNWILFHDNGVEESIKEIPQEPSTDVKKGSGGIVPAWPPLVGRAWSLRTASPRAVDYEWVEVVES